MAAVRPSTPWSRRLLLHPTLEKVQGLGEAVFLQEVQQLPRGIRTQLLSE